MHKKLLQSQDSTKVQQNEFLVSFDLIDYFNNLKNKFEADKNIATYLAPFFIIWREVIKELESKFNMAHVALYCLRSRSLYKHMNRKKVPVENLQRCEHVLR